MCGNSARTDLCGGCWVTNIPTATFLYAYAANNPCSLTDATGLCPWGNGPKWGNGDPYSPPWGDNGGGGGEGGGDGGGTPPIVWIPFITDEADTPYVPEWFDGLLDYNDFQNLISQSKQLTGYSITNNMSDANQNSGDYIWFYNNVKAGSAEGDPKSAFTDFGLQAPQWVQDLGNYNFGAMAAAADIPLEVALRGAGWAQTQSGNAGEGGSPLGAPPYGDAAADQAYIKAGYAFGSQYTSLGP